MKRRLAILTLAAGAMTISTATSHAGAKHWAELNAKYPPGLPCFFYPHKQPVCNQGPRKDYAPFVLNCPPKQPALYFGPSGPLPPEVRQPMTPNPMMSNPMDPHLAPVSPCPTCDQTSR